MAKANLRQRIVWGMLAYLALLTLAVMAYGAITNEYAERLVWRAVLESELDHLAERRTQESGYDWHDTASMRLYDGSAGRTVPASLQALPPGLHDDLVLEGQPIAAMVRDIDGQRAVLTIDISDFERHEERLALVVMGAALAMILLLGLAVALSVNHLVRPLNAFTRQIAALRPDQPGQAVSLPHTASSDLVAIAEALNGYLRRNDRFVERERAFIDSASHELRTPIAVIAGAAEIALAQPHVTADVHQRLARIQRTASHVEQLISLLLVLAKDPAQLGKASDRIALDQLLPEIVDDHRHLLEDKALTVRIDPLPACEILAPVAIVQTAIGNLLRNAIENSDSGEIRVRLEIPATVMIDDPGHGMTPEEISAIYARLARGGGDRGGGGIGLDLISRLCEHLHWGLRFDSTPGRGTTTTLRF
ncbi:sensor histidine kinase [Aerolutibacter ruishenii]|uniref:histidine kinase n=1 Tax=Aerolutibacter ruishenii TaxID=686800 RepID=A0A562LWP7_9GAMM|nr:HAMP domain-containing sensor histidine kinase [Lysobacter ruishenii]TWI12077.1 signal transduction histidine kinase [Lysobacter ruishenii]